MSRGAASPASVWGAIGALLAGLAVALGAFGAHILGDHLSAARLVTFETAVRYQFFHALALVLLGLTEVGGHLSASLARRIGVLLLLGTLFFSGSLYLLIATNWPLFGASAPIGGTALLIGWGLWAWTLWAHRRR